MRNNAHKPKNARCHTHLGVPHPASTCLTLPQKDAHRRAATYIRALKARVRTAPPIQKKKKKKGKLQNARTVERSPKPPTTRPCCATPTLMLRRRRESGRCSGKGRRRGFACWEEGDEQKGRKGVVGCCTKGLRKGGMRRKRGGKGWLWGSCSCV